MRIIGGEFKSRKIKFPKSKKTRPATDRSKETIFNILGETVQDSRVLDLFAGSGSLGLEALSRGAKMVYFVDSGDFACKVIKNNLKTFKLWDKSRVHCMPVERAIKILAKRKEMMNLVFLDPPYNKGLIKKILRLLNRFDIVAPFGKVVIGRSRLEDLPLELGKFKVERDQAIGQAFLSILYFDPKLSVIQSEGA